MNKNAPINVHENNNHYYNTNPNNNVYEVNYDTKETTIKELVFSKMKELVISIISLGLTEIIKLIENNVSLNNKVSIALLILVIIFLIVFVVLLVCFIYDIVQILKIKRLGKCVSFQSKFKVLSDIFDSFREDDKISDEREISKLIKNENGKIYEIKGCKCPLCKSEPIGYMKPVSYHKNDGYILECNENPQHRLTFDYKQCIINNK